ncbi:NADH-flavin oxidoreductase/NADH oxidase [Hyaloraphidium curvatum]|nr:NADH-flavin oxidoreductase/NADH oxidase [Hyaloraphidium curvatum]
MASASPLFEPIAIGDMRLSHRIAMGPMTRSRSPREVPNAMNVEYYAQRATPGGLLISEGVTPSVTAAGYADVPALLTEEQTRAWKEVTDAVHAKGGYIYAQLWHTGRVAKKKFTGGRHPVSASATKSSRRAEPAVPLDKEGIKFVVSEYRLSAKNAKLAGFDGVELHGAHGYLIDQFLQDSSNLRTDEYGGSIENRARFLFEVLDAVLLELPPSKVAIRLSPFADFAVKDSNPVPLFTYVLTRLDTYGLAYIQMTEPGYVSLTSVDGPPHRDSKLNVFHGLLKKTPLMLTGGYDKEKAEEALRMGRASVIGMARGFIVMPDFVERLRKDLPLKPWANPDDVYTPGPKGYVDYPTWEEEQKAAKL